MAKQNKARKFFATTATAALVASAIVPVASAAEVKDFDLVPSWAKDAVKYLVDNGSVQGDDNGNFNPTKNLSRAQAAEILMKELTLEATGTEDYSDVVSTNWFYNAVLATSPEIFEGNEKGQFLPNKELTRQEAAKVLVEAYGLTGSASLSSFADASTVPAWSKSYLETAVANGVMKGQGTKLAPNANITNAEFATMVKRAIDAAVPAVTAVSATNEKTLELTGNALKDLKAENITLANNEVVSVTPSANGKSATVTFKYNFTLDQEQTVKVTLDGTTKEFKFTYSLADIKSVELDDKVYDDDTNGQLLTFKVNGTSTTPDADFLRQAGYTVNFVAVNKATNTGAAIFVSGTTSSTGLLATKNTVGTYIVEVQIVKAGKVVVSNKKEIQIVDVESLANSISAVGLTNNAATAGTSDDFDMNSTTLVAGESATITSLKGDAAGKTGVAIPVGAAVVSSSNKAVVSVSGNVLTANAPGTAVVTIKVGNATKDVTITVSNKVRALDKVTADQANVTLVKPASGTAPTRNVVVNSVDQYGDPISITTTDVVEDYPKNAANAQLITSAQLLTDVNGEGVYSLQGAALGNGTVLFKNADGKIVGQITVSVTNVDNTTTRKIEFAPTSAVTSNTFAKGKVATYQFAKYSNTGAFNGLETLTASAPVAGTPGYYVESADTSIATVATTSSSTLLEVTAVKAGSTDITIKSESGQIVDKFTVTITASNVEITKVNFKATSKVDYVGKKFDVSNVLDVRADGSTNDPIVYGVEHNGSTINKVRLASSGSLASGVTGVTPGTNNLVLYIDSTSSTGTAGKLDATDTFLGLVSAEVLTGSTTAAGSAITPISNITLGNGSYTTASKDKGTILFRVKSSDAVTSTITSTTIDVEVN